MSVLIKHMAIPKGCIYANDKDQAEYCPLLNHDDVPFCQYIENEPEIAIGIDERPVYCPLFDVSESCQDTVSRAAAIDALDEIESEIADGYGYQYEKWRKYFCGLPSAQSEPQWIPCSERLPEDKYVLISKKPTKLSGSKWCVTIAIRMADPRSRKVNWRDIGFNVIQDNEVLAWMPLPEVYKERREDERSDR